MLYYLSWIFLWPLKFLRLFVGVKGLENIPRDKEPLVVVANHIFDLDPYIIGPFFPFSRPIHWLAKKELYSVDDMASDYGKKLRSKTLGRLLGIIVVFCVRNSLTIPVDRESSGSKLNREAVKKALEVLRQGKVVGVFGEGGIGRLGEVHPVFASLALKTGAKILPVKLEKGRIVFGKPIQVNAGDPKQIAYEVMEMIYGL